MFVSKVVFLFLFLECFALTRAVNSVNNYGDTAYPGRCVVEMDSSVVLLKYGESVQLDSLPCTSIYCIGDGWGLLQTCDYKPAPTSCHYSKILNWDDDYPNCCKRRLICD